LCLCGDTLSGQLVFTAVTQDIHFDRGRILSRLVSAERWGDPYIWQLIQRLLQRCIYDSPYGVLDVHSTVLRVDSYGRATYAENQGAIELTVADGSDTSLTRLNSPVL
jgi:hypothetical protein